MTVLIIALKLTPTLPQKTSLHRINLLSKNVVLGFLYDSAPVLLELSRRNTLLEDLIQFL